MVNYITFRQTISKVYTDFLPNADGCHIDFTPVGEANNWECVDEASPDEDDTYNYTTGATYDDYALENHGAAEGIINSVTAYARMRHTDESFNCRFGLRIGGSSFYSTAIASPSSYETRNKVWGDTNPKTSSAWTWADIDALQARVSTTTTGAGQIRWTQVYVVVDYTLPVVAAGRSFGFIFG